MSTLIIASKLLNQVNLIPDVTRIENLRLCGKYNFCEQQNYFQEGRANGFYTNEVQLFSLLV
jgi:hypothetical protein